MATLGQTRRRRDTGTLRQFTALFVLALAILVARDVPAVRAAQGAAAGALVPIGRAHV